MTDRRFPRVAPVAFAVVGALAGASCGPSATPPVPPASVATPAEIDAVLAGGWNARVVVPVTRGIAADAALAADGTRVAVAAQDGRAYVVGRDGAITSTSAHAARVLCVAFAPQGDAVVSASADGAVRVLGADPRKAPVIVESGAPIVDVCWLSVDDSVALDAHGVVRRRGGGGEPSVLLGSTERPVDRIGVLPGEGLLVAASRARGELRILTTAGHEVAIVDGLGEGAERFAVSPAEARVAVGSVDGRLVIWSSDGVREVARHDAGVQDVAFSSDGANVATASLDGTARVLTADGAEVLRIAGHGAPLHRVRVLPSAQRVLTVGADRRAVLWNAEGASLAELDGVTDAAFVARGRAVIAWSGDGPARAVTVHGAPLQPPEGTERGIVRLVTAQDADAFVWLAPDRTARVALAGDAGPASGPATVHPASAYAHPEWCARCHRPEYARWLASSHAWTSTLASEASLPRDVLREREVHHPPGVTHFGSDDDGWFAETQGAAGDVRRFRLTHVAGHKRMKMLLATMEDGRIQVLPAMTEWPDGPWFDYTHLLYGAPDEDLDTPPVVRPGEASFWTGAVRSWDQRCAVCHTSGRLARRPGPDGVGPRSVWRSLGVDCETCHGPGRAHAEAWERGETGSPLPRLEGLGRDAAIAVCTQCHMEGDRVTATYTIGDDLYEHLDPTLALAPDRADAYGRPLELIYDGLPFGTSHCAESGGLTCSGCHEPHGSALTSQMRTEPSSGEFCGDCHADIADEGRQHTFHDPRGSGGTCVACHMPFLTIERGHGAVADHTIGVPRLDLPGDRVAVDACTWCHSGADNAPTDAPRVGTEALRDAYARWWPDAAAPRRWMRAFAAARTGDPTVGVDLLNAVRDERQPRLVRATAARLLEPYADKYVDALLALQDDADSLVRRSVVLALRGVREPRVDAALRAALDDPSAAVRVNAARGILHGWERARTNRALLLAAIPILEADVERVPDDYFRWFLLGAARGLAADEAGALAAYERVLELDPLAHAVRAHVERLRERLDASR